MLTRVFSVLVSIIISFVLSILFVRNEFFASLKFIPLIDYLFFIALLFFSFLLLRYYFPKDNNQTDYLVVITIVSIIIFLYLSNSFLYYPKFNLIIFLLIPLFFLAFHFSDKYKSILKKLNIKFYFYSLISLFVIYFSQFIILTDSSFYISENFQNFSPVMLPIVNTLYGSLPPVQSISYYGYYSYFIAPLFFFIDLNVLNLTIIFTLLYILCFICLYKFINYFLNNSFLSFLIVLVIFYINTSFGNIWPGDPYFQYRPIRMLAPCLSLYFFYNYLKNKNLVSFFKYFFILSLLTIWNLETGLPTLLCFLFIVCVSRFFFNNEFYKNELFKILLFSLITLGSIWIFFSFYLFYFTGKHLTVNDLILPFSTWRGNELFFSFFPQAIILSIFIASFSLLLSTDQLIRKTNISRSLSLFFVSSLNISLLIYGSRNQHTSAICSYMIPLCIIFFINDFGFLKSKIVNYFFKLSLSFFLALFINDIFHNSGYRSLATFFDFILKNHNSEKIVWFEPDSNLISSRPVSLKELYNKKLEPKWKLKAKWLRGEFHDNNKNKIFIASEADHLLYNYMKIPTPVNIANWHHISHFNKWDEINNMLNGKHFDYVVTDYTYFLANADTSNGQNYNLFNITLNKNYSLYKRKSFGYSYFYPGWKETYVIIWKKND